MFIHAIARAGCTDIVRGSALKVHSGRKSLAAPGTQTRVSIAQSDALPTELFPFCYVASASLLGDSAKLVCKSECPS